jgi:hypothetical protein
MKRVNRKIVIGALIALLGAALFPPWQIAASPGGDNGTTRMAYGLITSPPADGATLNLQLLSLQWLIIVGSAIALLWFDRHG